MLAPLHEERGAPAIFQKVRVRRRSAWSVQKKLAHLVGKHGHTPSSVGDRKGGRYLENEPEKAPVESQDGFRDLRAALG